MRIFLCKNRAHRRAHLEVIHLTSFGVGGRLLIVIAWPPRRCCRRFECDDIEKEPSKFITYIADAVMEQKCLTGEEGFDADESLPALEDNYEQPKYEFVIEIDNGVFEPEKCSQEFDLIEDVIANDLLEELFGVIRGVQALDQIFGSGHGLLDNRA